MHTNALDLIFHYQTWNVIYVYGRFSKNNISKPFTNRRNIYIYLIQLRTWCEIALILIIIYPSLYTIEMYTGRYI